MLLRIRYYRVKAERRRLARAVRKYSMHSPNPRESVDTKLPVSDPYIRFNLRV